MKSEIGLLVRVGSAEGEPYIVFDGELEYQRFRFSKSCEFNIDDFLLGEAYRLILDENSLISEVQPLFEIFDFNALKLEIDMKPTLRPKLVASGDAPRIAQATPSLLKPANSLQETQVTQAQPSASMTILCTAMNVAAVLVSTSKSFDIKDPDAKNDFFALTRELDAFMTKRLGL